MFNIKAIYFNQAPVYGIKALITSILMPPFFGLIFGFFSWVGLNLGGFLYDWFLKLVTKPKVD
jgi:hypothetical protein